MDQDIKKEFENINQRLVDSNRKFTEEFEFLARAVKEGFDQVDQRFEKIEATMATKDEMRGLEQKMDSGFSSVHSDIHSVQEKLSVMDTKMDRLYKMETEDIQALNLDVENIKQQLAVAGK